MDSIDPAIEAANLAQAQQQKFNEEVEKSELEAASAANAEDLALQQNEVDAIEQRFVDSFANEIDEGRMKPAHLDQLFTNEVDKLNDSNLDEEKNDQAYSTLNTGLDVAIAKFNGKSGLSADDNQHLEHLKELKSKLNDMKQKKKENKGEKKDEESEEYSLDDLKKGLTDKVKDKQENKEQEESTYSSKITPPHP